MIFAVFDVDQFSVCPCWLGITGALRGRLALRWRLIRTRFFHMESDMAKKVTRSHPWTKEEVRMLKTLTREKTKMVIARKLKWSVDAMHGLASKLGVMLGGTQGGKRRGEQT
jgi:hypothetical protein